MCLLASDDGRSSLLEGGGGGIVGYWALGKGIHKSGLWSVFLVQLQGCVGEPGVCLLASDDGRSSLLDPSSLARRHTPSSPSQPWS